MADLAQMVAGYIAEIGKRPRELKDVRVIRNGPPVWDIELVFGNKHISYTRVAKIRENGDKPEYRSITAKTRLWVPFGEIPAGAEFYANADGPHLKTGDNGIPPEILVECEFFYAKGEGAIAGNRLWVSESTLLDQLGQDELAEAVDGCKFDFWATCLMISSAQESIFWG